MTENPAVADTRSLLAEGARAHRSAQVAVNSDDRDAARAAYRRRTDIARQVERLDPNLTAREAVARMILIAREYDGPTDPAATLCPCGIGIVADGAVAWSIPWHRAHRRIHLEAFPDVDSRTIANLDDAISHTTNTKESTTR